MRNDDDRIRGSRGGRSYALARIISGGQTGADRGALDAAIALGIAHGGFCPRGRRAEDGPISVRYALTETNSRSYAVRTEKNVLVADATLLVSRGSLTGGSALTAQLAAQHGKPWLHVDLAERTLTDNVTARLAQRHAVDVHAWLLAHRVSVLNVAGPRASECPGISDEVAALLGAVLSGGRAKAEHAVNHECDRI